jgi:hypothetical protein
LKIAMSWQSKKNATAGVNPKAWTSGAVNATQRLVGDSEGGALDGAFPSWFVWSVAVEAEDLGDGEGRDVEGHGLLGLPGEHQEGRQRQGANLYGRCVRRHVPGAVLASSGSVGG